MTMTFTCCISRDCGYKTPIVYDAAHTYALGRDHVMVGEVEVDHESH